MLDHDQLVRIIHAAFLPGWQVLCLAGVRHALCDIFRRRPAVHQTLKQRVRGHTVRAVKSGIADLTDSIQTVYVSTSMIVNHHATAGIVGRWHNGHRVAR